MYFTFMDTIILYFSTIMANCCWRALAAHNRDNTLGQAMSYLYDKEV